MKNLILSAMFGLGMVGCGGMEPATEQDVAETEGALKYNACVVVSATDNHQTGYCYLTSGAIRHSPVSCVAGVAFGTPVAAGAYYINNRICQ